MNYIKLFVAVFTITFLVGCVSENTISKGYARNINTVALEGFVYTQDTLKWNTNDYWQTAKETEKSHTGDCEDLAIYQAALMLKDGTDVSNLKFAYFRNVLTQEYHLVLLYKGRWLLDEKGVYDNSEFLGNTLFKKLGEANIYTKRSPESYFEL